MNLPCSLSSFRRDVLVLRTALLVASGAVPASLAAQPRYVPLAPPAEPAGAGHFMGATRGNGDTSAVWTLPAPAPWAGGARWGVETDPLDARPKFTLRIAIDGPDSALIVFRAPLATVPPLGSYGLLLLSTGASNSNPALMTGELRVWEHGGYHPYVLGGEEADSVHITADSSGVVRGTFRILGSRYDDDTRGKKLRGWVFREAAGAFAAMPDAAPAGAAASKPAPMAQPVVTEAQQRAILTRALDGFAITWTGAVNGDGPQDSVRSNDAGRQFLLTRWGTALTVDSIATNETRFYVRVRGTVHPLTCIATSDEARTRCDDVGTTTMTAPRIALALLVVGLVAFAVQRRRKRGAG